jgi:uncharacterized protein (DUF4415 family)
MSKPKAKRAPPNATATFPEIPASLLARMKPSKRGLPTQGAEAKQAIALRVDKEVLAAYKAQGPGWQSRMQATLKRAAERMAAKAKA